jgi:hypothetical protein
MHVQATSEQIVAPYHQGETRNDIASHLHASPNRVSHVLDFWITHSAMLPISKMGRPTKRTPEVKDIIEVRTLQTAHFGNEALARELSNARPTPISATTVGRVGNELRFKYREPRHTQALSDSNVADRVAFCEKVLQLDNGWVWYRKVEDNPAAEVQTIKFPPALMVSAVIGHGYKSRLLILNGSINQRRAICPKLFRIEFCCRT